MRDPRAGCRVFIRAYDRLLAERIYHSRTVDAVVQDCAVEICDATTAGSCVRRMPVTAM